MDESDGGGGGGRDCDGVLHDATPLSVCSRAVDNDDVTEDVTRRGGGGAVQDQESGVWVTAVFLVCVCVCVCACAEDGVVWVWVGVGVGVGVGVCVLYVCICVEFGTRVPGFLFPCA
jgi:hypothetical protein